MEKKKRQFKGESFEAGEGGLLGFRSSRSTAKVPFTAHLNFVTDLAVQLNALGIEVEQSTAQQRATLDRELEEVAVRFDRACFKALQLGVPTYTEFATVDRVGRRYVLSLTIDGVEYRAVS